MSDEPVEPVEEDGDDDVETFGDSEPDDAVDASDE